MERINTLRQQAAQLRSIAAGTNHPDLVERMLGLAQQCEDLADSLAETLRMARPPSEKAPR
jgi:hypothetical protein